MIEQRGELVGVVADAIGADHDLLPARLLKRRDARRCQVTQTLTSSLALPIQVNLVPSYCAACCEKRLERGGAGHGAEHGAVLGRGAVEPVGEPHPASAFHTLRHDRRMPGMCLPICRAIRRA